MLGRYALAALGAEPLTVLSDTHSFDASMLVIVARSANRTIGEPAKHASCNACSIMVFFLPTAPARPTRMSCAGPSPATRHAFTSAISQAALSADAVETPQTWVASRASRLAALFNARSVGACTSSERPRCSS